MTVEKAAVSSSAEENRRRFPEVAAALDHVRKYFPEAQVIYMGEPRSKLQPATDNAQRSK
jgi:hypothetical protein